MAKVGYTESVNVKAFGAVGDGTTDDSAAIQAAFNYVQTQNKPYRIVFGPHVFKVNTGLTLPTVSLSIGTIDIDGAGATLLTAAAITIFGRVPANQTAADTMIGGCRYYIHDFTFMGDQTTNQIGLHLGAVYGPTVERCHFYTLDRGLIGTWCMNGTWRQLFFTGVKTRSLTLRSAHGDAGSVTPIWTDGSLVNAASNVNLVENCRVWSPSLNHIAAYSFFGSDHISLRNSISEGAAGSLYDVHFDYQSSGTVRHFEVDGFHAEGPHSRVNFKVACQGTLVIRNVIRQYPAAFLDLKGSVGPVVKISGANYWGNMPEPAGEDANNPNGRWFYHSDGGGYNGTESGTSSGCIIIFDDFDMTNRAAVTDPARWESGLYPAPIAITGKLPADAGYEIYYGGPISMPNGVIFTERSSSANAAANQVNVFARDNGSGKTQLVAYFPSGAVQVLATEP